jgi:enamine deaminase RidA (YjgF/YER057c/UK114 family)
MATRREGGQLLYISGQVAGHDGNVVGKGACAQARLVFQNLRQVLRGLVVTSKT